MKKGKKLAAFSLALNAVLSTYAYSASTKPVLNIDNLYNKITANINSGKSNDTNYKLIERVLKQRNKELKDLYLQGDYIVKPEYLEWQIFATGFYAHRDGGDNTYGNAKASSKTEGYFDENGVYVQTSNKGKPFKNKQEPKIIELGMHIPLKEISRDSLDIQVNPSITAPTVPATQGMVAINSLNVPTLDLITFSPTEPVLNPVTLPTVDIVIPALVVYANSAGNTLLGTDVVTIPTGTHYLSTAIASKQNSVVEYGAGGTNFTIGSGVTLVVDVANRRAVSIDSNVSITVTNNGTIRLTATETAGLEVQSNPDLTNAANPHPNQATINLGTIIGTGNKQVGLIFTPEQDANGLNTLDNRSIVTLGGSQSTGIAVNGAAYPFKMAALNSGTITLNGTKSLGIAVSKNGALASGSVILNDTAGIIKVDGAESGGIAILSQTDSSDVNRGQILITGDKSFGLYSEVSNEFRNANLISITGTSSSIGLRSAGGNLTNTGNINITGGDSNFGMYSSSGSVKNSGTITIKDGTNNTGVRLDGSSSTGSNSSTISVKGSNSSGVIVSSGGTFTNTGTVVVEGEDSYGLIAQGGTIIGGTVNLNLTGANSSGAYAGGTSASSVINITGGNVDLNNGGINFNTANNGTINLSSASFVTGEKSLGFYAKDNGQIFVNNVTGTIKGSTNSSDRGTAFYLVGNGIGSTNITSTADIEALLTASGINITNLTLTMESGSRLFSLGNVAMDLSVIDGITTSGFTNMTVLGSDYKTLLHKGLLNIDETVDLDSTTSSYSKVEMASSSIINNSTITGASNSQQGMAQANEVGLAKSTVTLTNNGTITLQGQESVGIYADRGIIENNGTIDIQGNKSFGIFGANGTEVTTAAGSTVKAGTDGAGIVLQSMVTGGTNTDGTFKLDHDGNIVMSGSNTFGVYADNNDPSALTNIATRIVNLNAGSLIDMSGTASKGTALYVNKATANTSGDMKIGTDGIGIYAKDGKVNLTGGTIDLLGANSTGIYLDGTTDMTATGGTINVKGDNTTVFLIGGTATTTGLETIGINIDPNLKLTLANVQNNNFTYDGTISGAGKDSVIIAGDNSTVGFGINANISSTSENVVGIVAKGGSGENKGLLSLTGSDSVGLYGENSVTRNEGDLLVGLRGVGIYNENGTAVNALGKIETGANGVGIYALDSTSILNSALITSTESSVIGIYSDGTTASTTITNGTSGIIDLSGENVIGIYTTGTQAKTVTNDGEVKVGNSTDLNNPSIGIYNNILGSTIQNNGTISSGEKSLGVYNKGGLVTENGILNVGNTGTGILSEGGTVGITSSSVINLGTAETIGIYGKNNAGITNASSNITIGDGSYGFVLESGSTLSNSGSVTLGDNNVLVYGKGSELITSANTATITATGSNNIVFYTVDGGRVENHSSIVGNTGTGNIGIYNKDGSILNTGNISLGDSVVVKDTSGVIIPNQSSYSVGVYGEKSSIVNSGDISLGKEAVGIYAQDNVSRTENYGSITAGTSTDMKTGAIGIFADGGQGVYNKGNITLFGDNTIGIVGRNAGLIVNDAIINVTGKDSIGIYGTLNTTVENLGTINISGDGATGIVAPEGKIENKGTINISGGAIASKEQSSYPLPELINMGLITVNGHFSNEGMEISMRPDLSTLAVSNIPGVDFVLNSGTISANSMTITDTVTILPDFTQGTNAKVYKLENAFMTSTGQIISANGKIPVVSKSFTWEATPKVNDEGNIDIYMSKLSYKDLSEDLWYEEFAGALDNKYLGASKDGETIFDKIDLIENESDYRHVMASLAGNVYANMNKREEDISRAFDSSLSLMQNSTNNTKENVKINVIAGKGRTKEDTDGVVGYDYTTTGVLALREVERTYRHTYGYSLGYLHTGFEFKDGNESEEWVNTIQLGLHNKYEANNWVLRNDLTGRVSLYNIDRNIDWPSPNGRSEMNGNYETYSITSDNRLGKELSLGKKASLTPYGGLKAMYITRPTFTESGLESLEVKGNDAWSVKPKVGVELKGSLPLGSNTGWQLKGALDVAYEYELANLNEREYAKLTSIEDSYHKLSKPEKEKGMFRTRAEIGVEVEDRYGIFVTGEYGVGNNDKDEYRAGVTLKAVF